MKSLEKDPARWQRMMEYIDTVYAFNKHAQGASYDMELADRMDLARSQFSHFRSGRRTRSVPMAGARLSFESMALALGGVVGAADLAAASGECLVDLAILPVKAPSVRWISIAAAAYRYNEGVQDVFVGAGPRWATWLTWMASLCKGASSLEEASAAIKASGHTFAFRPGGVFSAQEGLAPDREIRAAGGLHAMHAFCMNVPGADWETAAGWFNRAKSAFLPAGHVYPMTAAEAVFTWVEEGGAGRDRAGVLPTLRVGVWS